MKGLNGLLYWIEAVEIVTEDKSLLQRMVYKKSSDKSNPPMLKVLVISVISAANQLEADWRWYSSAIHNLNTKIVLSTKWILINGSKY